MSFNFTGSKNVTGTLALNAPQSVSLVPGQDTALSFTATAGQTVTVSASSIVTTPANQSVALTVYDASNTSVGNISGTGSATLNLTNLAAGTYTVVVVPSYAATATMQVTLASAIGSALAMDGSTNSYATTVPGQIAFFNFSGTAGENVGLGLTGLVSTPNTGDGAYVWVFQPGSTSGWRGVYCYPSDPGCQISLLNLPTTGIYTVEVVTRTAQQTMSFTFTGSRNVTGTLALNAPQSVSLVPGQDTALSFTAAAGQTVAVSASSIVTTPANQSVALTVYDASNTSVGSTSGRGSAILNLTNLAAGTYMAVIVPSYAAAATMQVTIQ
jgi:RNase P/RNase MRP subunit p29